MPHIPAPRPRFTLGGQWSAAADTSTATASSPYRSARGFGARPPQPTTSPGTEVPDGANVRSIVPVLWAGLGVWKSPPIDEGTD